jgi:hypothetical protein
MLGEITCIYAYSILLLGTCNFLQNKMSYASKDIELAQYLVKKQNEAFDAYRNYEMLLEDKYGPDWYSLATQREIAQLEILFDKTDLALRAATRFVKRVGPEAFNNMTGGYLRNCNGRLKIVKRRRRANH